MKQKTLLNRLSTAVACAAFIWGSGLSGTATAQNITEGFDDITTLPTSGWALQNNSSPVGTIGWFQGGSGTTFPAYSGPPTSYIGANYNNTGNNGTISNWLLTPVRTINNGDVITFYTRIPAGTEYPDRLQVRLSTSGTSVNVGTTATSVGDFTTLLLEINPNLITGVYPQVWTQYTVTVSGLAAPVSGRFAFRYFVTDAGLNGNNSNFIGIDSFTYTSNCGAAFTLSPTTLPAGTTGTAYSQPYTFAGGSGAGTFAVSAGALPAGVTLSSAGVLSGTPTMVGNYTFTVSVTDQTGCTATFPQTLTVSLPAGTSDAGVTAITSPVSSCTFGAAEQVCITVSNAGNTTLTNIPVSYTVNGGTAVNAVMAGPLAPGATGNYCFTTTANLSAAGSYTIVATANVVGDANAGNNSSTVTVSPVVLAAPTATGASRCGTGSVTLTATAPAGTLAWYAAATGGNALALGNTFATPSISTTTTYYAAATTLAMAGTVGPLNGAAVGAGGLNGAFTNEMLFNALVPLRIDSVTLISGGAGTYTIGIRNMLSTLPGSMKMDSVTVSVPAAGTYRVYLGLVVPTPGTGYTLGLFSATTGSGALFRNTDGAVYPYTLPGVIAITGAAFGADPFTSIRYYNFYNWSVSTAGACESTRVPVIATVNAAPSAAFTFTNTGSTFNFAATSTTGTYAWTFAGGTPATATTANPTVTFATSGNKVVTLTVTENGCSTTFTQTVVISGRDADLNNALSLYPNPTTGLVQLDVKGQTGIEQVEVYNALGQLVKQQTFANQQQATLNLSGFAEGAYTVRVVNQHGIYVKQLLLQK